MNKITVIQHHEVDAPALATVEAWLSKQGYTLDGVNRIGIETRDGRYFIAYQSNWEHVEIVARIIERYAEDEGLDTYTVYQRIKAFEQLTQGEG